MSQFSRRFRVRWQALKWALWGRYAYPPTHFYSPLPPQNEVDAALAHAAGIPPTADIPGLDLNLPRQLELLRTLKPHLDAFDWPGTPTDPHRYYCPNGMFNISCGSLLYGIVQHFRPRRYLEVGSGFSSALMLDLNDRRGRMNPPEDKVELTFIDPYPQRLQKLLREEDRDRTRIIERTVQTADPQIFSTLEANDILFIDSSHVSKAGSDLNFLLLEVVPQLKPGVLVHFHDIYWPFEYPAKWLAEGRFWNEAYLLRAFLAHNSKFETLCFYDQVRASGLAAELKLRMFQAVGSSLWIRAIS